MRLLMCLLCAVALYAGGAKAQDGAGGGWLGAEIRDLTQEEADALGWDERRGARVVNVTPGSPAEAAGLQVNDVLVSLDAIEIQGMDSFEAELAKRTPGAQIRLLVRREGREKRLALSLGPRPAPNYAADLSGAKPQVMLDTGGHMSLINGIAFTPDGKQLVSASYDKTIRVWDLATGKSVRTIRGEIAPGDPGKVFAVALSPDGKWLAAGGFFDSPSEAGNIRLFDFATGQLVGLLKGHTDIVHRLAFSPNSRLLISGSFDKTAIIWDVERQQSKLRLSGHTETVSGVSFTPDNARAVTGSDDHDLRLWRVADGRELARMQGHAGKVFCLTVAADGTIASGDWSGEIRLWDGKTGALRKTFLQQGTLVGSLSFSRDSRLLLASCGQGGCGVQPQRVFDVVSGQEVAHYPGHDNVVIATAISPDGRWAATGGGNNNDIHLWDLRTGAPRPGPNGQPLRLTGQGQSVWSVGFAADGQSIAWGNTTRSGWTTNDLGPLQHVLALPSPASSLPTRRVSMKAPPPPSAVARQSMRDGR